MVETIAKALRGVGVNEDGTEKDINKTLKDVIGIDFTQIPTTVGEINNSTDFARELAKVLRLIQLLMLFSMQVYLMFTAL